MQEKKNALIVVNSFNIGGTVSSLYTLLSMVDTQKVHIDIFARNISGFYIDKLAKLYHYFLKICGYLIQFTKKTFW